MTKARRRQILWALLAGLWHVPTPPSALAQQPASGAAPAWLVPLWTISSPADDRIRLAQLLGAAPTAGYLLRSPSTLTPPLLPDSARGVRIAALVPQVTTTWNSAIPFSINDGAMWAGRGANLQVLAGIRAAAWRFSLILGPQFIYQQNRPFDFIPYSFDRSPFAYPFHTNPESLDMPLRFGSEAFTALDPGQSTLWLDAGPVALGASTENQWWGPGIRNGIVLSNHAAGIPHLFVRTRAPLRTPLGRVEAKWLLGEITESPYFDFESENDTRSLSAFAATLQPAFAPGLTLGLARAVYAPLGKREAISGRIFDAFRGVGRPNALPVSDPTREPGPDQIASLFARWVLPDDGFEAYAEWSRLERPESLRDLLIAPHHTQGYTLGLQWAAARRDNAALRVQAEVTYLEQSSTSRQRHVTTYYTSRPVPQGYTQRGQVIGASIGPGASSQWLASDYIARRWQLGAVAGRIRWDNDAHYKARHQPWALGHDVSVFAGLRGSVRSHGLELAAQYTGATRMNYLYQYRSTEFWNIDALDVRNHTLQLSLTPSLPNPW